MSGYGLVAQELAHIRAMILQLEQQVQHDDLGQASAVTSPDYWRARLNTLLAATDLPPGLKPQIRALLSRLEAIHAVPRNRARRDQQ